MLSTIVLTVFSFALLMAMMAVGVILQGKRLAGSCGGNTDSPSCRCTPEKQARCKANGAAVDEFSDEEADDFDSSFALTSESLAPPGEERLIQLGNHAPER